MFNDNSRQQATASTWLRAVNLTAHLRVGRLLSVRALIIQSSLNVVPWFTIPLLLVLICRHNTWSGFRYMTSNYCSRSSEKNIEKHITTWVLLCGGMARGLPLFFVAHYLALCTVAGHRPNTVLSRSYDPPFWTNTDHWKACMITSHDTLSTIYCNQPVCVCVFWSFNSSPCHPPLSTIINQHKQSPNMISGDL